MVAPRVEAAEPLALELMDFARAIRTGAEPRSSAAFGLEIVLAVEALHESLLLGGRPVPVRSASEMMSRPRTETESTPTATASHANGNGNGNGTHANGNGAHTNGNGNHANGNGVPAGAGDRALAD